MKKIWDFAAFGKSAALIDDTGVALGYDQLSALENDLGAAVGPGALTMLLCENSLGALAGYAALMNGGHPVLLVSAAMPADARRQIMNTYRPGLVFAPRSLLEDYAHMQALRTVDTYTLLKTSYAEAYPLHPALGQLLTTSGSTGSVKFVRQSWDNLRFNTRVMADYLDITAADRTITALPLHYTYGLSVFSASLLRGAATVVTRQGVMDEGFWDLMENEAVTAFHGVPSTYGMLRRLDIFCEDFPALRLMTQAGGKLSRDLQDYFARYAREYGKRFIIMYGQSEATAAISYLPADQALRKPGSVGVAVPGGEIGLIDEDGHPIQTPDTPGELVYRGPNVALGYATRGEDLIRGDDRQGEIRTGDLAARDADGFLYITGRIKRVLKMWGHRVSLDEIDEKIMNDIHVRCVSSGVDDHLILFVLNEADKAAVAAYVPKNIPTVRPAFQVVPLDAFPTNESGKILYNALLERAKQCMKDQR